VEVARARVGSALRIADYYGGLANCVGRQASRGRYRGLSSPLYLVLGWRLTPHSRARLFELVSNASLKHHFQGRVPPAVLFLSGDIHMGPHISLRQPPPPKDIYDNFVAEVSRSHWCVPSAEGSHVLPLLDVTSSGLTHSWDDYLPCGRRVVHSIVNYFGHGPFQVSDLLMGKNYATLEIEWREDGRHSVQADIRGLGGGLRYHLSSSFEDLRIRTNVPVGKVPLECNLERQLLVGPPAFSLSAKHIVVLNLSSILLCILACCCRTYRRKRKVL